MPSRSIYVAPLLLLSLLVPSTPVSSAESADTLANSPNLTHVLNLPHKVRTLEGANGVGGTDIEFTTLPVPRVDAEGNTVIEDRDFALAGTYRNGLQIIDITDPRNPTTAAVYDCVVQQGDVQVFERDGRTYAAYTQDDPASYNANITSACYKEARALKRPNGTSLFNNTQAGDDGTFVLDITNPYAPTTVSFFNEPRGSHNVTVAPGGRYFYNSNSDVGNAKVGEIEVWDLANFNDPTKVATLMTSGLSSHDITFNETGTRAYSAAVTHTLVLDTTNLAAPTIIGRIFDPAINIHHQSDPVTMKDKTTGLERTFLVITDEIAGAAGNAACPGGGLHVYDITGDLEKSPVKVGFWNIPSVRPTSAPTTLDRCTAHVLRMHPKEKIMTIAWYNAGVRVVDISGLMGISVGAVEANGNVGAGMREIGYAWFANGESWAAKTNRIEPNGSFYLYSNDQDRGLDIFRFSAAAPASAEGGTWLTPSEALARAQAMGVKKDAQTGPFCLYQGQGLTVG